MRLTIYEMGSSLDKLLSTLKKNRDNVPLEILKTQYKVPYETLVNQVNTTATAFVKAIITDQLIVNKDADIDEQIMVINQVIQDSGMEKKIRHCMSTTYNTQLIHSMALELRGQIEDALYPYIAQKTCLVADLLNIEEQPIIYNTLTQKVYENNTWIDRELDLRGKLLIYLMSYKENTKE